MQAVSATPPDPPPFRDAVHAALRLWHKDDDDHSPLDSLFLYRLRRRRAASNHQATNEVLYEGLESLALRYPASAAVLRMRFLDHQLAHAVANQLNVAESTVYATQKDALDRLADTLLTLDQQARATRQSKVEGRLEPLSFGDLVGIDGHVASLSKTLLTEGPPFLLALEGIGGIGKSALADALLRHALSYATFDDFGWVTARQVSFLGGGIRPVAKPALTAEALIEALLAQLTADEPLPGALTPPQALEALQARLQQPHLIVVDNLETVLDIEHLLPVLRRLAGPSKFVLTSRHSLFFEPGLRHFVVPELAPQDALLLLRREAGLRCLGAITAASDDALQPIYQTVGGNPLALKLVIGLSCALSLDEVLANLAAVRGRKAEDLHNYVYRCSWEQLDQPAHEVLLAMLLIAPRGGVKEDLVAITHLAPAEVGDALETLAALNLVDYAQGDLHGKRYAIHQLTRRFLEHQVLGWRH